MVQAAKQAAASELAFQASECGGLCLTVERRSGVAKGDKIGPYQDAIAIAIFCRCASDSREPPVPTGSWSPSSTMVQCNPSSSSTSLIASWTCSRFPTSPRGMVPNSTFCCKRRGIVSIGAKIRPNPLTL